MTTQEQRLAEMKVLSQKIIEITNKRRILQLGGEAEYHSPNELNKLKREFGKLQSAHKREWIKSFKTQ